MSGRVKIRLEHVGYRSSVTVDGVELACTVIETHTDVRGVTTATITVVPDVVETELPSGAVRVQIRDPFTGEVLVTHEDQPDLIPKPGEWWRFRNDDLDDWDYMRILDDGRFPKSMYRERCDHKVDADKLDRALGRKQSREPEATKPPSKDCEI